MKIYQIKVPFFFQTGGGGGPGSAFAKKKNWGGKNLGTPPPPPPLPTHTHTYTLNTRVQASTFFKTDIMWEVKKFVLRNFNTQHPTLYQRPGTNDNSVYI